MAGRKWNSQSVGAWIVESARTRAEEAERAPLSLQLELLERLPTLSTLELQSLSVRVGRYAWRRRLYEDDLQDVSRRLLRAQAAAGEELAPGSRAFLSSLNALLEALRYGDDAVIDACAPAQIERAAREVWREPRTERPVVDTLLVRSILEPLLAGDRAGFRTLLATLGRELVTLAAMGADGRLPGVTGLYGYAQLRTLQDALNGVLHASRVTAGATSAERATI